MIVDGTNADDRSDHRPGRQAARERGVESPLAELGFTKDDIRALSKRRGIQTWSQPSSPCLSSRLPYGTAVTPQRLQRVERAEAALRALGITGNLRVRYFGEMARVELDLACSRSGKRATRARSWSARSVRRASPRSKSTHADSARASSTCWPA